MSKEHISINSNKRTDEADIGLLDLPPENLMNAYVPLNGGGYEEKKHGQTHSSSKSISANTYSSSGAYSTSSSSAAQSTPPIDEEDSKYGPNSNGHVSHVPISIPPNITDQFPTPKEAWIICNRSSTMLTIP